MNNITTMLHRAKELSRHKSQEHAENVSGCASLSDEFTTDALMVTRWVVESTLQSAPRSSVSSALVLGGFGLAAWVLADSVDSVDLVCDPLAFVESAQVFADAPLRLFPIDDFYSLASESRWLILLTRCDRLPARLLDAAIEERPKDVIVAAHFLCTAEGPLHWSQSPARFVKDRKVKIAQLYYYGSLYASRNEHCLVVFK